MSNDRQLNYVNNLQNRDQNLYYVDDASELNSINLKENDKIYAINDNKLFQMEIADQDEELSGSIVSFNGRNNIKIKSVVANIEPVQDLHGYDNPWPAGGGDNKLAPTPQETKTQGGLTCVSDGNGVFTFSGTYSSSFNQTFSNVPVEYTVQSGDYLHCFNSNASSSAQLLLNFEDSFVAVTMSVVNKSQSLESYVGKTVKSIRFYIASAFSGTVSPMISNSSSASKFALYSNICPISGWTGANIEQRGKNLLNPDFSEWSANVNYCYINNVVPNGQIARFTFIEKDASISLEGMYIGFTDTDLSKVKSVSEYIWVIQNGNMNSDVSNISRQSGVTCSNVFIFPNTQEAFEKIFARFDIMVELGSTATAYAPYTGNQISINWQSEAGTVYGGTLDVTTGLLTVNRGFKVYDGSEDERISFYSGKRFVLGCDNYSSPAANVKDSIISNRLITVAKTVQGAGVGLISGSDPVRQEFMINIGLNTVPEVRSWLADNPLQVSYPLSSTVTYQLTPQKVKTLLGTNNIWADTGNIIVKIAEKGITAFELEPHI